MDWETDICDSNIAFTTEKSGISTRIRDNDVSILYYTNKSIEFVLLKIAFLYLSLSVFCLPRPIPPSHAPPPFLSSFSALTPRAGLLKLNDQVHPQPPTGDQHLIVKTTLWNGIVSICPRFWKWIKLIILYDNFFSSLFFVFMYWVSPKNHL